MDIIKKMSPNYSAEREGTQIDRIVIHWVGAGDAHAAANWFQSPNSQASAHYIIGNDVLYQCVEEQDTAWHAGNWEMNLRSIGIEHEARPDLPMTDEIYKRSGELVRQISVDYNIPLDRTHIIGHREVKSTQCPGTIDIDRIIKEAKMDQENQCEQELEEMRNSRDEWKRKFYEVEKTLNTEREDHAKTIKEKNETITQLNESNAKLNESNARLNEENTKLTAKNEQLIETNNNLVVANANCKEELEKSRAEVFVLKEKISKLNEKLKNGLCGYSWWERWLSLVRCRK